DHLTSPNHNCENILIPVRHASVTHEVYTLSLHGALPLSALHRLVADGGLVGQGGVLLPRGVTELEGGSEQVACGRGGPQRVADRSEEHTSELQSRENLV